MRRAILLLSTTMTFGGVSSAIYGIDQGYAEPVGIGLVLLCGAAVLALLFVGSRPRVDARALGEE